MFADFVGFAKITLCILGDFYLTIKRFGDFFSCFGFLLFKSQELTCFRDKAGAEGKQETTWIIPVRGGPAYEVG